MKSSKLSNKAKKVRPRAAKKTSDNHAFLKKSLFLRREALILSIEAINEALIDMQARFERCSSEIEQINNALDKKKNRLYIDSSRFNNVY